MLPQMTASLRRIIALSRKETVQIIRDPSSIIIAFVMPAIMLFLFGYGMTLDARNLRFGIVMQGDGPQATELAATFYNNVYFRPTMANDPRQLDNLLRSEHLRGMIVIPQDFDESLNRGQSPTVQIITDGSVPNTAAFAQNYARAAVANWNTQRALRASTPDKLPGGAQIVIRTWYNPELNSHYSLVPGSLTIIMCIVGTLLTSLIIAREWERGTMEALLSTPIRPNELLISKFIPYYVLGLLSLSGCTLVVITLFGVPFRGSLLGLGTTGGAFLLTALAQGLMLSALSKNQLVATQGAVLSAFLPGFILSGFVFEITSMPYPIQILTKFIPAKYLVTSLQTVFLTGDVWVIFLPIIGGLSALGFFFLAITRAQTPRRLQ